MTDLNSLDLHKALESASEFVVLFDKRLKMIGDAFEQLGYPRAIAVDFDYLMRQALAEDWSEERAWEEWLLQCDRFPQYTREELNSIYELYTSLLRVSNRIIEQESRAFMAENYPDVPLQNTFGEDEDPK